MDALDGVLADLIDADHDCAYVTMKRESVETLLGEWVGRGDQIALLFRLLVTQTLDQPQASSCDASPESSLRALDAVVRHSASSIAQHRHALRREFAARLKQFLRSAIADIGTRATDALLAGDPELAKRLESERRTVRTVMRAIDALVDRLLQDELEATERVQEDA